MNYSIVITTFSKRFHYINTLIEQIRKYSEAKIYLVINGVQNIISDIRHDHIKPGIGKYSSFNREFIYNRKYIPNNISPYKGMFDTPMDQLLPDLDQYPYERFYKENKDKL